MKNERGMMMETNKKSRKVSICPRWNKSEVLAVSLIIINVMLISDRAMAYERYKNDAEQDGSNCSACHGDFTSSISTNGTIIPSNNKHEMHRSSAAMDTACNLCHTNGDGRNAYIGSSQGTASNSGLGCNGCHGRDYGGIIGVRGAGLRAHHTINGVTTCTDTCHTADPAPLGEEVPPPFTGKAQHKIKPDIRCIYSC